MVRHASDLHALAYNLKRVLCILEIVSPMWAVRA